MTELRWVLLLAGLVFLAVLAAWEMRRSREDRREPSGSPGPTREPAAQPAPIRGEPELGHLPEVFASGARGVGPSIGRTPGANPPIVQLPVEEAVEEVAGTAEVAEEPADRADPIGPAHVAEPAESTDGVGPAEAADPAESADGAGPAEAVQAETQAEETAPVSTEAPDSAPLRVDWPPEGARQIIALRLTAMSDQRLSGRTARLALAACGFVHGRYGIFHQPSIDGRSLLSCASLSKPGIFDPAAMDFQRFAGLSLFMVLPGPLPAELALERLLETGSDLAQRLQAHLQDEQGRMLDASAIEDLRADVRQFSAAMSAPRPTEPAA